MSKKPKNTIPPPKNSFIRQVLEVFTKTPYTQYNFKQVSARLGITDKASRELVVKMIEQLRKSDVIIEKQKGKFVLNPKHISQLTPKNTAEGIVDMKFTGKAYVIVEGMSEDIFISANNTAQAFNGDKVKVQLFPKRHGRKPEGQIVEVLDRKTEFFVGNLQLTKKMAFVIPDKQSIPVEFIIPLDKLNKAKDGDKVIVQLLEWTHHSENPIGQIHEVLGKPGENDVEMKAILASNDFPVSYPVAAEKEAVKIPDFISEKEIKNRKDFREVFTCTIDPHDAKDFDDALSFRTLPNGNYEVGVHIADVSHYVIPGTEIDKEAYRRATSIYLVDRTVAMLPERLSNFICSLRPHEDKLCFSAVFELDAGANILKEWFGKTIIHSDRRFTYEEVQLMIEGAEGDFKNELMILNDLAVKLRAERFKKGSIAFRSQEVKFMLDENAKPVGAYIKEQKEAHKLIEDFMLLANRKVAEFVGKVPEKSKEKAPVFVYRIHDTPNQEKLRVFSEFIQKIGYKISLTSRASLATSFNNLFEQIKGKGEENMIESIAIRTMAKAYYSVDNIGHYGLAFKYYTHFTSPIRRYPDLMVHRMLEKKLENKAHFDLAEYVEKCKHCSVMEKKAADAERESVKYKQAEYMLDKIGQEFDGLVSGVSKWGLFVELIESKSEGLVSIKSMSDDFYYLDEDNYQMIGQRYDHKYRLGDAVRIKVVRVDLIKKQMDFELV